MSAFDELYARVYAIQEAADNGADVCQEDWDFVRDVTDRYCHEANQYPVADTPFDDAVF